MSIDYTGLEHEKACESKRTAEPWILLERKVVQLGTQHLVFASFVVIRDALNYLQIYPVIELVQLAFNDFECFILAHVVIVAIY